MHSNHLDFETYSEADLRQVGAYKYAEHLSTEVLILCYKLSNGARGTWTQGSPVPSMLIKAAQRNEVFSAHNAQFEYCIWNVVLRRMLRKQGVLIPKLKAKQLNCTAARAAIAGLPRSLGGAGAALQLKIQKDKRGEQLVKMFCMPRKPTKSNPDARNLPADYPVEFSEFIEYCETDVASEFELDSKLPRMSKFDRTMYRLDAMLNSRGIPIDIPMIERASKVVKDLEQRVYKRVTDITGGIKPTQVEQIRQWILAQDDWLDLPNLQAATIKTILLNPHSDLTDDVRNVLTLRMEAAKVSTKKLVSMARVACVDSLVRGCLLYYGAHTGRWSGRLVQPHNFIRGLPSKAKQIKLMEQVFGLLENGDADLFEVFFDNPLTCIAQCMRGFIKARKGKIFRIVDYAQIEARILVWLAGQEDVLKQFKQGLDVYKILAAFLWNIPVAEVTDEQRRIAKNLVLGCGFGLGYKSFIKYCAKNEVFIEEDMAKRAVGTYRERNQKVVDYWGDVQSCAIAAIETPGESVRLRNVTFFCEPDKSFLRIILPSGRSLYYADPETRIKDRNKGKKNKDGTPKKPWLVTEITFMQEYKGRFWARTGTYGGRLVENIVQAVACDVMVCGGIKAEQAGYPLVLTVHDEWLTECDVDFGNIKHLEQTVCDLPAWADGCPVTAEGFETVRYRKN